MRSCLADYDIETDDLEACGSQAEVSPCFEDVPVDETADWIEAYKRDLLNAIIAHYGQHEEDILASGGNTCPDALRSVDSQLVEEVTDGDDVPSGHDLDAHRVFTHPR